MTHDGTDDMFSVLRVVREFAPMTGGSITHILELSRVIDPYLKNQVIVAPHISGCEDFDKNFPIPIIRVKAPAICNVGCPVVADFFYSLYARKVIAQTVEEYGINIIHFHSAILASYLVPQLRLRNQTLRHVVMVHGWPGKKFRDYGVSYEIGKILIRFSSPDRYLILNDGSQIFDLQNVVDKGNIPWDVVYHGIDTSLFRPNNTSDPKQFTILFPHRPESIKRPDIALNIFQKFSSRVEDPTVCLTYLAADHADGLKRLAAKEGLGSSVHFMSALAGESMINCINHSSVVIGTSLNSNTGRAIQEAMACAKPVVVFNNGGISNLITHMENGILVEPGDTDGFAKALELLYHNPKLRDELGRKARETIIEKRSWDKRIKKELSVYEQVMSVDG
jgi:glycosyltransferase involved in cell wall biosynthesis